jgi:protein N-terminal glutamine amidohydrolase
MLERYTPYYCEENIYLLAKQIVETQKSIAISDTETTWDPISVVLITNAKRSCALLHQKAAIKGKMVFWDYHVIMMSGRGRAAMIWDLDTRLAFPCPAYDYRALTFPAGVPEEFRPLFRVIPAEAYLREFSSDRRHMRNSDGSWSKPPPAWPCLRGGGAESPHELEKLLIIEDENWVPSLDFAD